MVFRCHVNEEETLGGDFTLDKDGIWVIYEYIIDIHSKDGSSQ